MTIVSKVPYSVTLNTAPADKAKAWASGTAYNRDDEVLYEGKIYKCAIGNSDTISPDINIDKWVMVGNPNPTKFQDDFINTQTKSATTLTIEIDTGKEYVDSIGLFSIDAKKITIYDRNERVIVEKDLTFRKLIYTWWDYFFNMQFDFKNDFFHIGNLDYAGKIKFVIEPTHAGANLGMLVVGKKAFLGKTLYEPEISILDYSKKTTNQWGYTHFRKGKTAKYVSARITLPSARLDYVRKTLEKAVGDPTLYILDERPDKGLESLTLYGTFKDVGLIYSNYVMSALNVSIEGVI